MLFNTGKLILSKSGQNQLCLILLLIGSICLHWLRPPKKVTDTGTAEALQLLQFTFLHFTAPTFRCTVHLHTSHSSCTTFAKLPFADIAYQK